MSTGEDEPLSGLNGRLRPRKSTALSPQNNKILRKTENKNAQDRLKRTPSKATSTKADDLANKSDLSTALQLLCPYCDKKFASKQAVSKHVRRIHLSGSKQDSLFGCLFCNHGATDTNDIVRHMVDSHPNQYFACLDCHARFPSTSELAEHKLNVCEKQKMSYRSKLRQKGSTATKKNGKSVNTNDKELRNDNQEYSDGHRFNGIVISCELKPTQVTDEADIEDNITTNLILPPSKNLGTNAVIEKNAVIVLDDIQWNKRMPTNFSFHNTDADQILSRLGVVHRSPRTGESTKRDWFKNIDESAQKFEKCFDTSFYSKVASNVQENLTKFLDGSFNFNPDADSTIKTRKLKNSVVINTAEGFPILLACEQYSRNVFDSYLPRTIAPKHKWKWENDKNPMIPDDIKRDSHVNNCIITLVSSLDIWTQLCMRRKFEDKFNIAPLEKKSEKQNAISKELKEILESREIPSTSSNITRYTNKALPSRDNTDFPASLGLKPSSSTFDVPSAVLSGEWVRPRCYVCCACGAQTRDSRALSSHITTQHPNAHVQHYEIVGELLLNADILKHLYVPPTQLCNRTRPLRGIRECTKCKKPISLEDLHQHMLDCAGDTPTVRRKCRYRPFGVRRRRPRLPDNTIRKKIRKDIRRQTRQTRQKSHIRPRPKIRSEVGDAETIRKMLADLPAKRHRVMVTPMNSILRPRKKLDKQRSNLMIKRRSTEAQKTRQQRETNRNENNLNVPGTTNEDNNDKLSLALNNDDDDDKPLRTKIKRVLSNNNKQKESMKRKVALNRAKRRAHFKDQTATTDPHKKSVAKATTSSSGQIEQLSVGNTPQRIDVPNSPYNTREHSSRNRSNNNNNEQIPGCSGQNGNMNNAFIPVQNNVPLKHSIARLTADTDMHDKSLQLHQMYLLQQGCNNTNQHESVGQRPMFENEAVVTKLDKPPLHFQPRGVMDPYAFQKNKLNKPRKGLNDCIAMLKNKLVDPFPILKTAQSVGSASNEPLICESATTDRTPSNIEYHTDVNTKPAEVFSRHQFIQERLFEIRTQNKRIREKIADFPIHYTTDQKQFELLSQDINTKKTKQNTNIRQTVRESTKKKSKKRLRDIEYKKFNLPPHIQLIPHETIVSYPVNVNMSTPSHMISQIVIDENKYKTYETMGQRFIPKTHEQNVEKKSTHLNPLDIRKPKCVPTEPHFIGGTQIDGYINVQSSNQNQSNMYIERDYSKNISDNFPDREVTKIIQHEPYQGSDFNKVAISGPPPSLVQTDSNPSNLDPTLPFPLDLTVNITDNSELSSKQNSSYDISDYESYETLDLSNKSSDHMREEIMVVDINNDVVDLRIKSNPQNINKLEQEDKIDDINSATDLTMKSFEIDNVPTDLTIKKKPANDSYSYDSIDVDYDCIQDLSKHNTNIACESVTVANDIDQVIATDLSGKNNTNVLPMETTLKSSDMYTKTLCSIEETSEMRIKEKKDKKDLFYNKQFQNKDTQKCQDEYNVKEVNHYDFMNNDQYTDKDLQSSTIKDSRSALNKLHNSNLEQGPSSVADVAFDVIHSSENNKGSSMINVSSSLHSQSVVTSLGKSVTATFSVPFSTLSGPIPLYTLSNPLPSSKAKYESTTPVYALANACISMTKIETSPSNTTLFKNLALSNSSTTVASTVSQYSLTDVSMKSTENIPDLSQKSSNLPSAIANISDTKEESISCRPLSINTQNSGSNLISKNVSINETSSDIHLRKGDESMNAVDLDPETAKKIAMLPKELVEILGTMPVDHRNQLLNILPQYVSKSTSNQLKETGSIPVPTQNLSDMPLHQPTEFSHSISLERETKPIVCLQNSSETSGLDESNVFTLKKSSKSEIGNNRVIDLTEDDTNITKAPEKIVTIQIDPPVTKSIKTIVKDQTASLRAVRIKAPSERKRSVCTENKTLKTSTVEQHNTIHVQEENKQEEISESTELNKTLAIQQAEVSSTQHNTTGAGNFKYPLAISPNSTESSSDESGKNNSQTTVADIVSKQSKDVIESPLPKSILISSSFSPNKKSEINVDLIDETAGVNSQESSNISSKVAENVPLLNSNNKDVTLKDESVEFKDPLRAEIKHVIDLIQQEDSEDDLSLAAIVKQKQRNQESEEYVGRNVRNPDAYKKKKKNKRAKKTGRKGLRNNTTIPETNISGRNLESSSMVCNAKTSIEDNNGLPLDVDQNVEKIDPTENLIGVSESTELNKHSKKKIAKSVRRHQDALESSKLSLEKHDTNYKNKSGSSTNETHKITSFAASDNADNEVLLSENENSEEAEFNSEVKMKNSLEIANNSNLDDKILKRDIEDTSTSDKNNFKTESYEIGNVAVESNQAEYKSVIPENNQCMDTVTTPSIPCNQLVVKKLLQNEEGIEKVHNDKTHTVILKKEKKCVRLRNVKTVDTSNHDIDLGQALNIEDSNVTPLRRSRRGKSLFIESTSIEKDILNCSEISAEQKTPLTKKQLIFSKLLLDETKPNEPAHSTPEKQPTNEKVLTTNTTNDIPHINIPDASDTEFAKSIDKTKGIKRRISPPRNKKCKKKKLVTDNLNNYNNEMLQNSCTNFEVVDDSTPIVQSKNGKETSVDIVNKINLTPDNQSNEDNQAYATEKRKICNNKSIDVNQSSKPKRSKTHDDSENNDVNSNKKYTEKEESICNQVHETRTACYNLPVPAKRGRSKSVVVKSTAADSYDPYDIDLEDMIEQHESFRKKNKSSDYASSHKKLKTNSATAKQTIKTLKEKDKSNFVDSAFHENISVDKPVLSDSDESSKSDIPLQKYVEEKEKNTLESEMKCPIHRGTSEKTIDSHTRINNENRSPCSDKNNKAQNEAEQELRSEQFMESFGFFSQRKPRKSNLLATKKISETFHINNESDDMYFGFKQRSPKKSLQNETKKIVESEISKVPQHAITSKRPAKRGRKKKSCTKTLPSYCSVCKKEFRRPDNYLRHQMNLLHISKLSEVELKVKTIPIHEEPNYLVAYKLYLERFKKLTDKLAKLKKKNPKAAAKIVLPTMKDILSDVNRTVREQQRSQRGLSRDEELFIDCCELLKESHRGIAGTSNGSSSVSGLDLLEKAINEHFSNECESDDDVDSITAQNILESEEVRNLENDLITGLKEAANATRKSNNIDYDVDKMAAVQSTSDDPNDNFTSHYQDIEEFDNPDKMRPSKSKKHAVSKEVIQIKEKMYPDIIEDIDMFEDKFDKIKRKCRSQAAAAKQTPLVINQSASHKARRKAEKKKGKKISKKTRHQSTQVPTKGALKGFDGIKVSIPTSEINLSALVPASESSPKKKKKSSSKKKRDKKDSECSSKCDSDHRAKESSNSNNKKVDVYEFMDNEDAELFEFRPSTLMERFKSISNKDVPSTSKLNPVKDDNSSESGSDGDDFVYMSDDYVCSDDETENSLLSCENGNLKVGYEVKKNCLPHKRKDVVEKNAVMGKIFKHNAVRTEKKVSNPKEASKPKANLDQLFDSLLEEEPSTSMLNNESVSPESDENELSLTESSMRKSVDHRSDDHEYPPTPRSLSPHHSDNVVVPTIKRQNLSSKDYTKSERRDILPKKYDMPEVDYGPSTSKNRDYGASTSSDYEETTSEKCNYGASTDYRAYSSRKSEYGASTSRDYEASTCRDYSAPTSRDYGASTSRDYGASTSRDYGPSTSRDYGPSTSRDYGPSTSRDYGPSTSRDYGASVSRDYGASTSRDYGASTSKDYGASTSRDYGASSSSDYETSSARKCDYGVSTPKNYDHRESANSHGNTNSPGNKHDEGIGKGYDYGIDLYDHSVFEDETGVARQRARRKCTVGKQNVLAESWSSESEPDGAPPRPNSAESDIGGSGRKKKGKKKDSQQAGGRRGNTRQVALKKHENESRVNSNNRTPSGNGYNGGVEDPGEGTSAGPRVVQPANDAGIAAAAAAAATAAAAAAAAAAEAAAAAAMPAPSMPAPSTPGPSTSNAAPGTAGQKGRNRSVAYFWSSETDDEQHQQQHGWIVGDSHKKLVTMLAHAKGRRRNNDDRRHLME